MDNVWIIFLLSSIALTPKLNDIHVIDNYKRYGKYEKYSKYGDD